MPKQESLPWENQNSPVPEEKKNLIPIDVLVDADIVAYRVAAACNGNHYRIRGCYNATNTGANPYPIEFKYKREAKAYADKHSIPISDIYADKHPESADDALLSMRVCIRGIQDAYRERGFDPIMRFFLSAPENFRYKLYDKYKANRKNKERPVHLPMLKFKLVEMYQAVVSDGYEADDLIAMATVRLYGMSDKAVSICSVDKDFCQLLGSRIELFDYTTGAITDIKRKDALKYFYRQLLQGDSSDNIPGIKGVGPQTAIKLLKDCDDEVSMCKVVLAEYKERLDLSDYKTEEMVRLHGRLLYLTRVHGVLWDIPEAALV